MMGRKRCRQLRRVVVTSAPLQPTEDNVKSSRVRLFQVVIGSVLAAMIGACGPSSADDDDDDGQSDVDAANNPNCTNPVAEVCDNGQDDDCDLLGDCDDSDCSDSAACTNANCGILENVSGSLSAFTRDERKRSNLRSRSVTVPTPSCSTSSPAPGRR